MGKYVMKWDDLRRVVRVKQGGASLSATAREMDGINYVALHRFLAGGKVELGNLLIIIGWTEKPIEQFFELDRQLTLPGMKGS